MIRLNRNINGAPYSGESRSCCNTPHGKRTSLQVPIINFLCSNELHCLQKLHVYYEFHNSSNDILCGWKASQILFPLHYRSFTLVNHFYQWNLVIAPVLEIDSFILNWSCFKSTLEIYKKWHCFPLLAAEINKNESTSLFILLYICKNMVDASLSLNDNKKLTVWITTQLWISRVSVLSITPFYNIAPKPLCVQILSSHKRIA